MLAESTLSWQRPIYLQNNSCFRKSTDNQQLLPRNSIGFLNALNFSELRICFQRRRLYSRRPLALAYKIVKNMFLLSFLIVSVHTVNTGLEASDCTGKKYITIDDPRRSTAYDDFNSTKLCDRNIIQNDAWYRFSSEAGAVMPTTMPKVKRCGTFAPIWMNGSHPSVEDGIVTRKVCANVPRDPLGCKHSYDIQVRNCSGYYIYQLKKPPTCDLAYCAGMFPVCI